MSKVAERWAAARVFIHPAIDLFVKPKTSWLKSLMTFRSIWVRTELLVSFKSSTCIQQTQDPSFFSSSSVKFCCSVTVTVKGRLLHAFLLLGGLHWCLCENNSLLGYTEQYLEYDPFLTPPDPSNPWISDDTTLWELEARCVMDTFSGGHPVILPSKLCSCVLSSKEPSQQRVKRWAFGIDEVLKDPVGREQFLKFLESEFSSENLRYDQRSPAAFSCSFQLCVPPILAKVGLLTEVTQVNFSYFRLGFIGSTG